MPGIRQLNAHSTHGTLALARLGIPGLDDILKGGLRRNSCFLLLGAIGTGKTTFGSQFLLEGLRHGENAILIRVKKSKQTSERLEVSPLGMKLQSFVSRNKLHVVETSPEQLKEEFLNELLATGASVHGSRALIEVGVTAGNLEEKERQILGGWAAGLAAASIPVIVTNRHCPDSIVKLGPALDLAPEGSGCLLLRYHDASKSLERDLLVLTAPGVPPLTEFILLSLDQEGFSLGSQGNQPAKKGEHPPLPIMFLGFSNSIEKNLYTNVIRRTLAANAVAGSKPRSAQIVHSESISVYTAPSTDYPLMMIHLPMIPFLASQGHLMPVEECLPHHEYVLEKLDMRKVQYDNRLYGVPVITSTRALYYRRDLLEKYKIKPPRTWADLELACSTILNAEKNPLLKGLVFDGHTPGRYDLMIDMLWSQGDDFFENQNRWIFSRKGVEEALMRLHGLFHSSHAASLDALHMGYYDCVESFLGGEAVFLLHWTDVLRQIHEKGKEGLNKFGWTIMPCSDLSVKLRTRTGGHGYVIPRRTRYPAEGRSLLKAIASPRFQADLFSHPYWPFPSQRILHKDPAVRKANPYISEREMFMKHAALVEEIPFIEGDYQIWQNTFNYEVEGFFEDPAGRKNLGALVHTLEERFTDLVPKTPYGGLVTEAIRLLVANIEGRYRIEQLAKDLKVSRSYLIREFKRQVGMPPLKFLNQKKIDRAKELLRFTNLNVSEVAYKLGFEDLGSFGKLFRKIMKRPASDFKRSGQ
jgi:ABC-type glycerol-3-phosphate transport system substrate-binding protein/AraC-like DNA-binding protein